MKESTDLTVVENRDYWIGGSDIPAIMGVSSFSTAYELARDKISSKEPEVFMQKYIDFGNIMEPQIRDYINDRYGYNYQPVMKELAGERLRANVDGFDGTSSIPLLEIKTCGNKIRWEEYELQMQLYMYVFDVNECLLALYHRKESEEMFSFDDFDMTFDSDKLAFHTIKRDNDALERILSKVQIFIGLLDAMKDSTMTVSDFDMSLYGSSELLSEINTLDELMVVSEQLKQYELQIKTVKSRIRELMIDSDVRTVTTDNYKVTAGKDSISMKFDSKRFKKDYPELYDKYLNKSNRKGSLTVTKVEKD